MNDILHTTIKEYREGLHKKLFSAQEAAAAYFARIKETDKKIGAYLSLDESGAEESARQVDALIARGEELPPLAGVPIAVKDNILVKGLPATAGSKILERYTARYNAGVVKKLRAEHAIFLGKTNLDEFGMGSSTENSAFQITRNPHNPTLVPGGSSGGSAAAVASHLALGALGSDTGGSIRQPAGFCGVVGLKPTYGAVSRSGLIALASSLDQIGPIARTVEDAAEIFSAISGADTMDATTANASRLKKPKGSASLKELTHMTIGIPKEYFEAGISPDVQSAIDGVRERLGAMGFAFKNISLPHTKYALSAYYIIMPAEASTNLARFDGIRYGKKNFLPEDGRSEENVLHAYLKKRGMGFGSEPKRRIILGTFVLSSGHYDAYYAKAQQVRSLIRKDFEEAFRHADVMLTPVSPTTAFRIGEKTSDPLSMYLSDIFTIPASLAGVPAIAIPTKPLSHFTADAEKKNPDEMPIGFQLIGKHFHEHDLLAIGQQYEKTHGSKIIKK